MVFGFAQIRVRKRQVIIGLMAFWSTFAMAILTRRCQDLDLWGRQWAIIFCLHGWISTFISKFGAIFFDFECCEFTKSHFELQSFSHFWNVNVVFSTGRWVEPFNGLLTFFIFLTCYLRSFLYKGMLLPSSLRHMLNLQLSSPTFKIFFF